MKDRTLQDLLAERRANVLESMTESDPTAKAMLLAHVSTIDAELARRHAAREEEPEPCDECGEVADCAGDHLEQCESYEHPYPPDDRIDNEPDYSGADEA